MTNESEALIERGGDILSPAKLAAVFAKRWWMVALIVIALPAVVGMVVSKQPKQYQAGASVIIDSTVPQYMGSNFKDVVELEANWWSGQELLQTELKVLKSHSQAVDVAKALCERHVPHDKEVAMKRLLPKANCENPEDLELAAGIVQNMADVVPIKESRVVNITVEFNDAEFAAFLANTMAHVYIERNLARRLSQEGNAAEWLGLQYTDLSGELNTAERALIDFKKQYNIVAVGLEDQQNDLSNRRKKLTDELNTVDVKLIAVRAQRDQYARLQTSNPLDDVTPGVADNAVVQKLKAVYIEDYSKLLELKGKYGDKHPALMAYETRLEAVKSDLAREAGLAAKSVNAQYEILQKQEHDLRSALDGTTHDALALEQRAIEYNRLKRNFDRLAKLSEQVGGRERETSLAGHLKTNNVRLLDAALVPTSAIAPNVPRSVAIAIAVAFALALALALLLEALDTTVKTQDDVERASGMVFLGLIPRMDDQKVGQSDEVGPELAGVANTASAHDLYVLTHPKSAVAECCRAIRTNLLFMSPDQPLKTLLVTSARPQEGKTTTAISLAITMAQSGLRTLLIDTDMRRPRLHKAFGIPATTDGISRAIVGEVDAMACVRESGIPNLYLLPCGAVPPNPAELLHTQRFKHLLDQLSSHFDRVILDSPPVLPVTDSAILSRLTHGTIVVAKAGQTSKDTLASLVRQLKSDSNVNVLGCILNDLDVSRQGRRGYYDSAYGYYYGGYGSEATAKNAANG